ncbi:SDR family NAD(P)-dependent oxidoreductase [Streptomyces sp. TBY4]|uniref:SDR family NAD(P)-dependent oxidoreductase n=1 Tax=Streptomyces sp. TBY4 TaxID=2962030 RepID=UPI0020B7AA49|nr:SDR family NAD(P)-dependent oxidoreductase [Streptomyces sp. TBY4]MCP3760682.1 SDR family oxidoreductase [Streptomyces sp. TBY4]
MGAAVQGEFAGKTALVTGASSGIGAATARLLAEHGAAVVVNYRANEAGALEVVEEIRALGGRAVALRADVTSADEVARMVAQAGEELGEIDILIANAAGVDGRTARPGPLLKGSVDNALHVVDAQLRAFLNPVHALVPGMIDRGNGGAVVAVGASLSKRSPEGFGSLSMSKSALEAAVKTLARETGPSGIRVNMVAPGLILSSLASHMPEAVKAANAERTAVKRNGVPADVAESIVFLASARSSYLAGSYILVDGGTAML